MIVNTIVAVSQNNIIANNQLESKTKIPWYIREDLKKFKQMTTGYPVIMGRKTFEAIGKPLSNRYNIIITRNKYYDPEELGLIEEPDYPNIDIVDTLSDAFQSAEEYQKSERSQLRLIDAVFILGGSDIYRQALPFTQTLYLTLIKQDVVGDVTFPFTEIHNSKDWELTRSVPGESTNVLPGHLFPAEEPPYEFRVYENRKVKPWSKTPSMDTKVFDSLKQ